MRRKLTNGLAVLANASVANNGTDSIIVSDGLVERFENEASSAFSSCKARVCSVIKRKCFTLVIEDAANIALATR